MKLCYYTVLAVLLTAVMNMAAGAQDYNRIRQELQEEQQKARTNIEVLRRQIEEAEQKITQTDDEYERVFQEYQSLEREIALRDEVIKNLQEEVVHLVAELELNRIANRELRRDLERLIENYQKTLTYLYKNGRTANMALLLTSESINQVLRRSYYLNKFEEHRQRQARQIMEAREEHEETEKAIISNREYNESLIKEERDEHTRLRQNINRQEENIIILQQDRRTLEETLTSSRQEIAELENTLNELIEEEVRVREAEGRRLRRLEEERRRRLAAAEETGDEAAIARYSAPTRSADLPSDEELAVVEEAFSQARGQLPWPVSHGAISAQFGNKVNPLYGTEVNNPGVEIATEAQSPVRVVHEGYVFAVRPLPGFGNCIFVNHGRYITVYGNLSEVRVRRNTYLQAGDVIALSGDDNSLKGAALFFMVREGNENLDPEEWITRN